MLEKILKRNYTKIIIWVVIMFVLFMQTTFAADNEVLWMWVNQLQKLLKFLLEIWFFLAWIISALVGWFMTADWTTWVIFWLDEIFKELWVLISNLVYFVFAFLLIAIAFMNIIWRWWDNFALKTALPKFIVWVLIVPFTWFIVQFVVSLSSVLTASVMQLPSSIFPAQYEENFFNNDVIPTDCTVDLNKVTAESAADAWFFTCKEDKKTSIKNISETSPYWIIAAYSYDLLGFQNIAKVWKEQISDWTIAKNISLLLFQAFKVVFFVVYIILLISMFFALFVRVVRLWLFMIFSPMFGLMFYFGKWSESLKNFNFKQFIALALVPVYVAAALSFWIFFLKVVQNKIESPVITWTSNITLKKSWDNESTLNTKVDNWWKEEEVTLLKVKWNLFNWKQNSPVAKGGWGNPLWPIWDLIINVITLAIIWISVMAALKASDITGEIIKPIADFGTNIWGLMKKLPQYTPIPWLWLDMKWLWEVSGAPLWALQQLSENRTIKYKSNINEAMWWDFDRSGYDKLVDNLGKWWQTKESLQKSLAEMAPFIQKYWLKDPRVDRLMKTVKEAVKKDPKLENSLWKEYGIKDADFAWNKQDFATLITGWNKEVVRQMISWLFNKEDNKFAYWKEWARSSFWATESGFKVEEVDWRDWTYTISTTEWSSSITLENIGQFKNLWNDDVTNIWNHFQGEDVNALKEALAKLPWETQEKVLKEIITKISPNITKESLDKPGALDELYKKLGLKK